MISLLAYLKLPMEGFYAAGNKVVNPLLLKRQFSLLFPPHYCVLCISRSPTRAGVPHTQSRTSPINYLYISRARAHAVTTMTSASEAPLSSRFIPSQFSINRRSTLKDANRSSFAEAACRYASSTDVYHCSCSSADPL
jgi:hypothetical protein